MCFVIIFWDAVVTVAIAADAGVMPPLSPLHFHINLFGVVFALRLHSLRYLHKWKFRLKSHSCTLNSKLWHSGGWKPKTIYIRIMEHDAPHSKNYDADIMIWSSCVFIMLIFTCHAVLISPLAARKFAQMSCWWSVDSECRPQFFCGCLVANPSSEVAGCLIWYINTVHCAPLLWNAMKSQRHFPDCYYRCDKWISLTPLRWIDTVAKVLLFTHININKPIGSLFPLHCPPVAFVLKTTCRDYFNLQSYARMTSGIFFLRRSEWNLQLCAQIKTNSPKTSISMPW